MKEYKRKRLSEEQSIDAKPTKIKKQLNSSERWRGKRDINKQLDELNNEPYQDKIDQWNQEIARHYNSTPCVKCLMDHAVLDKLGQTFYRLGFVVLTNYGRDTYSCKHKESDTA